MANQTQEQSLHMMHKGPDGVIYVDYMGSMLEDFNPDGGEITFNNALNLRLKFLRGWKKDGLPAPQVNGSTDAGQFCMHCGKPSPSEAMFCNSCGKVK